MKLFVILLVIIANLNFMLGQKVDSLDNVQTIKDTKIDYSNNKVRLVIQNIDVSNYPIMKVVVEAFDNNFNTLDTLYPEKLSIFENNLLKEIISIEKLSLNERVPIDFIFVLDQTATMQQYLDDVKKQILGVSNFLKQKGIDYNLGMVLYSDVVDRTYQPVNDVYEFISWLNKIRAYGGGDIKENTLEAIANSVLKINWRKASNKIIIVVTDAPFHQKDEEGDGKTNYNESSIISLLNNNSIRLFSITPSKIKSYKNISESTRGYNYDIDYPFSTILNNFSSQLTSLFAIKYRTLLPAMPDSVNISIINELKQVLTKKTIPILELGRKIIIENLLYSLGKAELPEKVSELEVLTEFMTNKPKVKILVEGHTDNIGSIFTNDKLSLQRAESVRKYLISKKIAPNRIKVKGYGSKSPISSNTTEFGRKLNRRTEIVIIEK